MRHRPRILIPVLAVALSVSLSAAAQTTQRGKTKTETTKSSGRATTSQGQALPKPGQNVVVRGALTGEGVECQALRGDDGKLYTLAGKTTGFKAGDKVRVLGTVAEVSTCQQGTTLDVRKIQKDRSQAAEHRAETLNMVGILTDEGGKCQAFRSEDGQLYSLTSSDLKGAKIGDEVRVTGKVQMTSSCQHGIALAVQSLQVTRAGVVKKP